MERLGTVCPLRHRRAVRDRALGDVPVAWRSSEDLRATWRRPWMAGAFGGPPRGGNGPDSSIRQRRDWQRTPGSRQDVSSASLSASAVRCYGRQTILSLVRNSAHIDPSDDRSQTSWTIWGGPSLLPVAMRLTAALSLRLDRKSTTKTTYMSQFAAVSLATTDSANASALVPRTSLLIPDPA
jgi:hypothetical protein